MKNFTATEGNAHTRYSQNKASQSLADAIKEHKIIEGIKEAMLEELIHKIMPMLMHPKSDIHMIFLLLNYGVDLFVAIEFRS